MEDMAPQSWTYRSVEARLSYRYGLCPDQLPPTAQGPNAKLFSKLYKARAGSDSTLVCLDMELGGNGRDEAVVGGWCRISESQNWQLVAGYGIWYEIR